MRKQKLAALAVFAFAIMAFAKSSWAFTGGETLASSATVTVGGSQTASFTLALKNDNAPFGANQSSITWTAVVGSTWAIANQFIALNSTVTDNGGGIEIYTDNENATAVPKYVGPGGTDPSGLVEASAGLTTLSVAWNINDSTQTVNSTLDPSDPNTGPATGPGNRFQWLFMLDRNTPAIAPNPAFSDGEQYVTMIKTTGWQGDAGSYYAFPGGNSGANSYVYLEANFGTAGAGATYATNKLTVEAFTH